MRTDRLVSRARHVKPDDEGVAAVEFALVLPLLIMLIFIMVIGGSVYVDQLQLQSAARNAARVGSIDSSKACPQALTELATNNVGVVTCQVTRSCPLNSPDIEVRLTSVQTVSIPIIGDKVVTLNAASSFICTPA